MQALFAGTLMPFYYLTVTGLYSEFVDGRINSERAPPEDTLPEIRLR